MKKYFILLFALLWANILPAQEYKSDYSFEEGGIYYKLASEDAYFKQFGHSDEVIVYYGAYRLVQGLKEARSHYSGSLVIPQTVTHDGTTYQVKGIHNLAFYYCEDMERVIIPESITFGSDIVFQGCNKLNEIVSFSPLGITLSYTPVKFIYTCPDVNVSSKSSGNPQQIPFYNLNQTRFLRGCDFTITDVAEVVNIKSVYDPEGNVMTPDHDTYSIRGMHPYYKECAEVFVEIDYAGESHIIRNVVYVAHGSNLLTYNIKTGYTSAEFAISGFTDSTCPVDNVERIFLSVARKDDRTKKYTVETSEISETTRLAIEDLEPGAYEYTLSITVYYKDDSYFGKSGNFNGKNLNLKRVIDRLAPNVAEIHMEVPVDLEELISDNHFEYRSGKNDDPIVYPSGNRAVIYLISPGNSNNLVAYCYTIGGKIYKKEEAINVPDLTIGDMKADVVSPTEAILRVGTNLADAEDSFGMEWRKIDAPEEIPSKQGFARAYDGRVEGRIKNLSASTYYKFRLFAKFGNNYRYSDWLGFDTGDFSYFAPEVHSVESTIDESTVLLRGYALEGTDQITEQGFEYWVKDGDAAKAHKMAPYAGPNSTTATSWGQVMTVTIPELQPNTVYCWRAYAKTDKEVVTGEIMEFTTPEYDALLTVEEDQAIDTVDRYINIQGASSPNPFRGLNIVMYKSGKTKKIFVR